MPVPPMPIPMPCCPGPTSRPEPFSPVPVPGGAAGEIARKIRADIDALKNGKADKAAGATEGNLAALDENGNFADSGVPKDGVYLAPEGGIPKTDLASDVQASLGKADTALQEHQDISGKAEKSEMSVTPGTGADADKTTIQLKSGTSATVLVAHQDISGKADLVDGTVPSSQLPSYVDDVLEYASASAFPATGEAGKIYIALDTNVQYRWSGTQYSEIAKIVPPSTATPAMDGAGSAGSSNAYARGDHRHPTDTTRASTADCTLTPRYSGTPTYSEWECASLPGGFSVSLQYQGNDEWAAEVTGPSGPGDVPMDYSSDEIQGGEDALSLVVAIYGRIHGSRQMASLVGEFTFTRTRTDLRGCRLGPADGPNADKPLASEAEAEALRTAISAVAPDWTSGGSYAKYDVVKYNGVYYYAKQATSGTTAPSSDTTNWDSLANLAALAHLFLPLTGGTMSGVVTVVRNGENVKIDGSTIRFNDDGELAEGGTISGADGGGDVTLPTSSGILALLENIAPDFSISDIYDLNALCLYEGVLYRCTTAVTTAGAWTGSTNWTAATVEDVLAALRTGKQDALSQTQLANIAAVSDALAFDATHTYAAGDPVVYNGTLYTFTAAHTGAWTGSDVSAVDIIARLAGKLGNSGAQTLNGPLTAKSFKSAPGNGPYVILEMAGDGHAYLIVEPTGGAGESKIRIPYADYASGETFALLSNIPYSLATVPASGQLADRAVNKVALQAGTSAFSLTPPTQNDGRIRDFLLRIDNTATGAVDATATVVNATLVDAAGTAIASLVAPAGKATAYRLTEAANGTASPSANPVFIVAGANTDQQIARKLDKTTFVAPFSAGATYEVGMRCVYNNTIYRCTTFHDAMPWDPSDFVVDESTIGFLRDTGGVVSGRLVVNESGYAHGGVIIEGNDYYAASIRMGIDNGGVIGLFRDGGLYALAFKSTGSDVGCVLTLDDTPVVTEGSAAHRSKLDSTSAAPDFSATATYDVGNHVTYLGVLYECVVAKTTASATTPNNDIYDSTHTTNHWKVTDMTTPDATLDVTSAGALRVVGADGTLLWQQGYNLNATSSATQSNEGVNCYAFAQDAVAPVALSLPTVASGKVGDFILDVTNPSLGSPFSATASYAVGDRVIYNGAVYTCTTAHTGAWSASDFGTDPTYAAFSASSTYAVDALAVYDGKLWKCHTAVSTAGAWTGTANWQTASFTIAELTGNSISVVVPSGRNLTDMLTIGPGYTELYFTLTAFQIGGKPTWKVMRQDVENGGAS